MRARIEGFSELPYIDDDGEPIIGAIVPGISDDLRGRVRLVELLTRSFEDIEARLPERLPLDALPLLICTREATRPGASLDGVVSEVEERLGRRLRRNASAHLARGSVSVFEGLQHARNLLAAHRAEGCLVAAVDTLVDVQTLRWLNRANRLKTAVQSDGVIPGEAAVLLLVTGGVPRASCLTVRGLGFAVEIATVLDDEPLRGTGMAEAVRQALVEAGIGMHDIDFRLSDVGGESYAFQELVLAQARLMRQVRQSQVLWHSADTIGDTGAASGGVQLAWIEQGFARGYAPGRLGLAHGGTAAGERAAAVVSAGE